MNPQPARRLVSARTVSALALSALLGALVSPVLFVRAWEEVLEDQAYAQGHLDAGLWTQGRANASFERIDRAKLGLGLAGALVGLAPGSYAYAVGSGQA